MEKQANRGAVGFIFKDDGYGFNPALTRKLEDMENSFIFKENQLTK